MGDSGSLVVGLIIAIIVIQFNECNIVKTIPFSIGAAPAVSFAIIIVPLVDTLRVMTIRMMQSRSPFSADNNHIHHRLLTLIPSHLKITVIIISTNVVLIGIAFLLNNLSFNVNIQLLIIFLIAVLFLQIPSILIKIVNYRKRRKEQNYSPQRLSMHRLFHLFF